MVGPPNSERIKFATDMEKSVLMNNFEKRGWVQARLLHQFKKPTFILLSSFVFIKQYRMINFCIFDHPIKRQLQRQVIGIFTGVQSTIYALCSVLKVAFDLAIIKL